MAMYQQYINQAVAPLSSLTQDELKELLADDEKLEERVNEVLVTLESEKDEALSTNRRIAEENLTKEPDLIERKSRINDLTEQGKSLSESIQEKISEVKSKSSSTNADSALALLQAAAAEAEEESEDLVKQLMEKEVNIDTFLTQFQAIRKTMHLRKVKAEKMAELINQKSRHNPGIAGGAYLPNSSFYSSPPGVGGPPYGSPSVPYPMGPIHMPMPGQFMKY